MTGKSSDSRGDLLRPRILLAVADEERRQVYEKFLAREQAEWQTVSSLKELAEQAAADPFHAILLDMVLIVRSSRHEKFLADDALRALPTPGSTCPPATAKS